MSKLNKGIDSYIRDKLNELDVSAPAESWDFIEENIREKPQRKSVFMWISAAASIIILIGIIGYFKLSIQGNVREISKVHKSIEKSSDIDAEPSFQSTKQFKQKTVFSQSVNRAKKENENQPQKSAIITSFSDKQIIREKREQLEHFDSMISRTEIKIDVHIDKYSLRKIELKPPNLALSESNSVLIRRIVDNQKPKSFFSIKKKEKDLKKWAVSGSYSPILVHGNQSNKKGVYDETINEPQIQNSFLGGISFQYNFSEKLSVQAGIAYVNVNLKSDEYVYAKQNYSGTDDRQSFEFGSTSEVLNPMAVALSYEMPEMDAFSPTTAPGGNNILFSMQAELSESSKYIEIPFILRYKIISKKVSSSVIGGFSTGVLVSGTLMAKTGNQSIDISDYKSLENSYMKAVFGVGFSYEFIKNISLSFEPCYRYALNSQKNYSGLNEKEGQFLLNSGVLILF